MIEEYIYYGIIGILAIFVAIALLDMMGELRRTLKKRRKNRLLQQLVVYGDIKTRILYIQNPLPDSLETLRERRRSLSQWLGSSATDAKSGCEHEDFWTSVHFDVDYRKYTVVHKCLSCGETCQEEITREELETIRDVNVEKMTPKWEL